MTAGLPGVGLAGLFYMVSALLMPLVELGRALAGHRSPGRWRVVTEQFLLASALLASFVLMGVLLSRLLPQGAEDRLAHVAQTADGGRVLSLHSVSPFAVTATILVVLLAVVVGGGAWSARRHLPDR